jgi:hypothetical protein
VLLRPVLAVAMLTALFVGRLPDGAVLAACIAAFGADYFDGVLARRCASGAALTTACVLGLVANLEGIAISLLLRHDVTDVPTFWHARRMRREVAIALR